MLKELKESYGNVFEDALINEIIRVGALKELPEGFKLIKTLYTMAFSKMDERLIFYL